MFLPSLLIRTTYIACLLIVFSITSYSQSLKNLWKKADSLEQKGLHESVVKLMYRVQQTAANNQDWNQWLKANLTLLKHAQLIYDDSLVTQVNRLLAQAGKLPLLHRQVWYSYAGSFFQHYGNSKSFEAGNQFVRNNLSDDFSTWTAAECHEKSHYYFKQSLIDEAALLAAPLESIEPLLSREESYGEMCPTVWDLLHLRYLEYLESMQKAKKLPNDWKQASDAMANLVSIESFLALPIEPSANPFGEHACLLVYKKILKQHLPDENQSALIEFELNRLDFVRKKFPNHPGVEAAYLSNLEQLAKNYASKPVVAEVLYTHANYLFQKYFSISHSAAEYSSKEKNNHSNNLRKAENLCREASSAYPKTPGGNNCSVLLESLRKQTLDVKSEDVLQPELPNRVLLQYRNLIPGKGQLTTVYINIYDIDADKQVEWVRSYNSQKLVENVLTKTPLVSFTHQVVSPDDLLPHSTELPIQALPAGHYMLALSTNAVFDPTKQAVAFQKLTVSNLWVSTADLSGEQISVMVRNRKNGKPEVNATVEVMRSEYDYKRSEYKSSIVSTWQTDADGSVTIKGNKQEYNTFLRVKKNGDSFIGNGTVYFNEEQAFEPTENQLFLFTDRSLYRPGQTLYFKGVYVKKTRDESVPLVNKKIEVGLMDANFQELSKQNFVSNEYGSINGAFVLPSGKLNGSFTLQSNEGSTAVQVEEYKRPKFLVTLRIADQAYRLGDQVEVEAIAETYTGLPIANAEITFTASRNSTFWHNRSYGAPTLLSSRMVKTDENGRAKFVFDALPELGPMNSMYFRYEIEAEITDANGETRTGNVAVTLSTYPIQLSTNLTKEVQTQTETYAALIVKNAAEKTLFGIPVQVNLYELSPPPGFLRPRLWPTPDLYIQDRQAFKSLFPNDVYEDETNEKTYARKLVIQHKLLSGKDSTILIPALQSGKYLMVLNTIFNGDTILEETYFTAINKSSIKVEPTEVFKAIVPDTILINEPFTVQLKGQTDDAQVLVEVYAENIQKGGQELVYKNWLALKQSTREFTLNPKANWGKFFIVQISASYKNSPQNEQHRVALRQENLKMVVQLSSFRNKIEPGQKEMWEITLKGGSYPAEVLAAMYDASLDAIQPHSWYFQPFLTYQPYLTSRLVPGLTLIQGGIQNRVKNNKNLRIFYKNAPDLNSFDFFFNRYRNSEPLALTKTSGVAFASSQDRLTKRMTREESSLDGDKVSLETIPSGNEQANTPPQQNVMRQDVALRKNLNETAFFMPSLLSDANGNLRLQFTSPEALTRWKFMVLAHDKNLHVGNYVKEVTTQKKIMVTPNWPRFLRRNDTVVLSAKINLTENISELTTIQASLQVVDAVSGETITKQIVKSEATLNIRCSNDNKEYVAEWRLNIPDGLHGVEAKVSAVAANVSDGESILIPVITNRKQVTESLPFILQPNDEKIVRFEKLPKSQSPDISNQTLTLEYTENPIWNVVQALPYLMESDNESPEQLFSRLYANSLAAFILEKNPEIKQVIQLWQQQPETLTSNLNKNQELKNTQLAESPWLRDALSESEQKHSISLLFDSQRIQYKKEEAFESLKQLQNADGSFAWFKGMHSDRYITQYITEGIIRLRNLGALSPEYGMDITENAINHLIHRLEDDHRLALKEADKNIRINAIQLHFLYVLSQSGKSHAVFLTTNKAAVFYLERAVRYWTELNVYEKGMLALICHAIGYRNQAEDICKSLMETAIKSKETGMYWKSLNDGYWYQAPIETTALMSEVFDKVTQNQQAVSMLQQYLLLTKQTTNWKSSKATANACYALLTGNQLSANSGPSTSFTIGSRSINPVKEPGIKAEAGSGYFKTVVAKGKSLSDELAEVKIKRNANSSSTLSYGSLYWQYEEDLNQITSSKETALNVSKKLYLPSKDKNNKSLNPIESTTKLKKGDKILCRIEIDCSRPMEYIHLQDMRAGTLEPELMKSGYQYSDGLGYYQCPKDQSMDFFIHYLQKGKYVIEYPMWVQQKGTYSNGITSIQCMYAPEFSGFTSGTKIQVE